MSFERMLPGRHDVAPGCPRPARSRARGRESEGSVDAESVASEEHAVSRSTTKAAIEKLTVDGLLQRSTHKTARVTVLTGGDVSHIYHSRLFLESEAIRELAANRRVPSSATEANDHVRAAGSGPKTESVEPDMRFHAALIDAPGSPRLERMYRSLVHEVQLCMAQVHSRGLLNVEHIAAEHQEILNYIAAGDAGREVSSLRHHLRGGSKRLATAVMTSPINLSNASRQSDAATNNFPDLTFR